MKHKRTMVLILVLAAWLRSVRLRWNSVFGEHRATAYRVFEQAPCPGDGYIWTPATISTGIMAITGCQVIGLSLPARGYSGRPVIGVSPAAGTPGTKVIGARKSASTAASITQRVFRLRLHRRTLGGGRVPA